MRNWRPERYQQKQPPEVFYRKTALKNFAIFTGKHLCWSLILKRDSNTDVFLLILRNFEEQLRMAASVSVKDKKGFMFLQCSWIKKWFNEIFIDCKILQPLIRVETQVTILNYIIIVLRFILISRQQISKVLAGDIFGTIDNNVLCFFLYF